MKKPKKYKPGMVFEEIYELCFEDSRHQDTISEFRWRKTLEVPFEDCTLVMDRLVAEGKATRIPGFTYVAHLKPEYLLELHDEVVESQLEGNPEPPKLYCEECHRQIMNWDLTFVLAWGEKPESTRNVACLGLPVAKGLHGECKERYYEKHPLRKHK